MEHQNGTVRNVYFQDGLNILWQWNELSKKLKKKRFGFCHKMNHLGLYTEADTHTNTLALYNFVALHISSLLDLRARLISMLTAYGDRAIIENAYIPFHIMP